MLSRISRTNIPVALLQIRAKELPPRAILDERELVNWMLSRANWVRQDWLLRLRTGQLKMLPLAQSTIKKRRAEGNFSTQPLLNTGKLAREIERWPIEITKIYDGDEEIYQAQMGPEMDDDLGCIAKDMFFGNPAVGPGKKMAIPARPLEPSEQIRAKVEADVKRWLSLGAIEGDPDLYGLQITGPKLVP